MKNKKTKFDKFPYPDCMDKECIKLCDAINNFPGCMTGESCCGHGDAPFYIIFYCDDVRFLSELLTCIPPHLSYTWRAIVREGICCTPFFVMLEGTIGDSAYKESGIIAKSIYRYLSL